MTSGGTQDRRAAEPKNEKFLEVAAMRTVFFFFALFLAGCTGEIGSESLLVEHTPEISSLALSPSTAAYMEGGGTSLVTAEISFRDSGRDIQALRVRMPDGRSMQITKSFATETGTFTEAFTMPTNQVGAFPIEVWLVDQAGDSSLDHTAWYSVSNWTVRADGIPGVLSDIIWDGAAFIAVGEGGTVMTSSDGIDWIARQSGVHADLHAIAAYGSNVFAVGQNIILQSTDHGATWSLKNDPDRPWAIDNQFVSVDLTAAVINSSQVVVGGTTICCKPIVLVSGDRGDTWQVINLSLDPEVIYVSDIAYRDGVFVAAADSTGLKHEGHVFASSDGALWNRVFHNPDSGFRAVVDDGSRFTLAGRDGVTITSIDGLNWTEIQTPFEDIDYWSGVWDGTKLVLAGAHTCRYEGNAAGGGFLFDCSPSQPGLPIGISTTDSGLTWDIFNIDGEFGSFGMAFGNGRFVAVGRLGPDSGEGAIYTAD
jgi:hypothetical protein